MNPSCRPEPVNRVDTALRIVQLAHSLGDYDANVLGIVGEVIAEDLLGMVKIQRQAKTIDGYTLDGESVQVKALSAARIRRYGGGAKFRVDGGPHPQRIVVILVFPKQGQFAILFDGKASEIGKLETVNGVLRRGVRIADLCDDASLRKLVAHCCK